MNEENEILLAVMLCICFVFVGIGVVFFVRTGIIWASFEKLLQEGDYSRIKKEKQPLTTAISTVYWLTATAIYLGYSLFTNNWGYSWIIWVIAGVLFPAVIVIANMFGKRK